MNFEAQCCVSLLIMKKSLLLLFGFALCSGGCTAYVAGPPPGPVYAGPSVGVVVEDRPYYTHGPYYVSRGARYVWVNGHYVHRHGHRYWVHGRYVIHG
jgi:hypothetical protein